MNVGFSLVINNLINLDITTQNNTKIICFVYKQI